MAHKARHQVPSDNALRLRTHQLGRETIVFFPQCQEFRAHGAGKSGPIQHRQDNRDAEINEERTPSDRQDSRQRHPKRYLRERLKNFDHPLDDQISDTSVVTGNTADHHAEDETHRNSDQTDGERYARAVNDAG